MRQNIIIFNYLIFVLIILFTLPSKSSAISMGEETKNLADQLVKKMHDDAFAKGTKLKIAVMELSDINGNVIDPGKLLAEELIMPLFLTKKFIVIERNLLNKILKEHSLQLSGLIDANTVKKIGKVLGVDAICSGTMALVGDSYKINIRLISTETGMIIAAASNKMPSSEFMNTNFNGSKTDSKTDTIIRKKSEGNVMPIEIGTYRVMVKVLNLRKEPSTSSTILEGLVYGDKVQVIEVTEKSETIENIAARWVKVITRDGKQGYLFSGFLLFD